MNVTREVIHDLLVLIEAGAASPDSQALVKTYLAQDPAFSRLVEQTRQQNIPALVDTNPPQSQHEMQAFQQTRRWINLRSWLLALAIFMTGLCFAFYDTRYTDGVRWLWQDNPAGGVMCAAIAAGLWAGYILLRRRLAVSGL